MACPLKFLSVVMAGLDPAIHGFPTCRQQDVDARDKPGITNVTLMRHSSRSDDLLALLAEAVDAERHDVADIEEGRRLHAGADAGRGAGGDDVAGLEGEKLRDVG